MRFTQLLLGIMTALLVAGCMAKTAVLLDKNAKEKVVAPASFYLSGSSGFSVGNPCQELAG